MGSWINSLYNLYEDMQINDITYCNFPRATLTDWIDEPLLSELSKVILKHDMASTHAADGN